MAILVAVGSVREIIPQPLDLDFPGGFLYNVYYMNIHIVNKEGGEE